MIRHARPADHPAIREINEAAFPTGDEARLIEALRAAGDVMFELVAVADGAVVGHILFSRLWADRTALIAALAPMAVRPEHQRKGLGSRLVETGIDTCREFGAHAVIVLGHPDYYPRFGFVPASSMGIEAPDKSWGDHFQFLPLALWPGGVHGTFQYAEPFAAIESNAGSGKR